LEKRNRQKKIGKDEIVVQMTRPKKKRNMERETEEKNYYKTFFSV